MLSSPLLLSGRLAAPWRNRMRNDPLRSLSLGELAGFVGGVGSLITEFVSSSGMLSSTSIDSTQRTQFLLVVAVAVAVAAGAGFDLVVGRLGSKARLRLDPSSKPGPW